jgi:hypothetical protein
MVTPLNRCKPEVQTLSQNPLFFLILQGFLGAQLIRLPQMDIGDDRGALYCCYQPRRVIFSGVVTANDLCLAGYAPRW